METRRTNLLKLLESVEVLQKEFEKNYSGHGLLKKFKRLIRYRGKYLRYCFAKFRSHSIKINKTKTFWGADFLSGDFAFYSHGLIGGSEIKLTKFLIKNIDDNSVFYDIGANVGYYSLLVKEISDSIEVHSFEPVPKTFEYLKKNLSKTQNIFFNQLAFFNKESQIDFYNMTEAGDSGCSTFNASRAKSLVGFKKIKVQATTLDKYCANHSKPTFLKIDVEGAESQVIEGGIKTLKETSPIISMEVWRKPLDNASHLKAIEILYNLGYKSYKIDNEGELEFIEKIDPERDVLKEDSCDNFDNFIFRKL